MPRKGPKRKSVRPRKSGSRSAKTPSRKPKSAGRRGAPPKGAAKPPRKSKSSPRRRKPVKSSVRRKSPRKGSAASTATRAGRTAPRRSQGRKPAAAPRASRRKLKGIFPSGELEKFREHLLALRSNRMGDKESREKEALKAANQDVSVDHMADFGSDNYEQEFTLGLIELDVETLRDIEDALVRIVEGTYGLCEECGKKITKARLRVLPHARMCVACKMKEE